MLRQYLGGVGLGTYVMLREGAVQHDPLAPEAPLAFVFSPLVGSPVTTSAKFAVVCKGPLTDRLNDSLASSGFALAGKKCGADAIVVTGRSSRPSILIIDNGEARLESAESIWGAEIGQAEAWLRQTYGADFQFAVIGPAGERCVRYATLSHDGRHAGRGGSGAVLGAKNLKAVAVRGQQRCVWHDATSLVQHAKRLSEKSFGPATAKYRELGTAANLLVLNRLSALPTRNFQDGRMDQVDRLAPESLGMTHARTRASCVACTVGCEHIYALAAKDDPSAPDTGVRVEYENLFALGPLCGIVDGDVVLRASQRCDQLGLDTISTGGTIAFAMECVERGWLDAPWLRFGDGDALLSAIECISNRQGIGDSLAEGSRRLAARIGPAAERIAPQVKGLEIPGYEPRAMQTMALGFAVGTRGADHNRSGAYEVDLSAQVDRRRVDRRAVPLAIETEDRAAVMDSLILCKFLRGVFDDLFEDGAELLRCVTGWDLSGAELHDAARRIINAKKWFNIQAGWRPQEDTLPDRFLEESLATDGEARLSRAQLAGLIVAYNRARGWTDEGELPEAIVQQWKLRDGQNSG